MMLIDPQDGKWYVVVTCEECKSTIFLFRDLNNGSGSLKALYGVICPHCRHKVRYDAHDYQHPTGRSSSCLHNRSLFDFLAHRFIDQASAATTNNPRGAQA